ncbi:MAG: TIGR02449 family protein [Pseudomonadales bacterium]
MDITALETRVDELIALCNKLRRQQASADADRDKWRKEKAKLLEQNELAKTKVEAMLTQLKSLKQG